ncbi:hypothetical protein TRVA0_001S05138 [Trichomonascus vanleenenianus]|uniref:E3 ubiquitin-protein ligase MARCH n=1 Tax=Trichomonascus vanleenenianus TaxID=2268995 RepID=UPI003ECA70F7
MVKTCRICYGTDEDSPVEYGRLISPCKCAGTAKYVHLMCLQDWRKTSPTQNSFYQCDVCKYRYSLKRTRYAAMLMTRTAKTILTIVLLNMLAFALGYVAYPVLEFALTDEDIELIRKFPVRMLKRMGVRNARRYVKKDGLLEHHILGTAAVGAAGFIKISFTMFYSSSLRRRRNVSVIVVALGLLYAMYELYKLADRITTAILRRLSGWVVDDVPEDLDR